MTTPVYAVNAPTFRRYIPISIVIVLTLIQGLLIVGCDYIAYHAYNCKPQNINLGMILFFKYFGGQKCDNSPVANSARSTEILDSVQGSSITIEKFNEYLPSTVTVANRVYLEIMIYGVINVLWIITSILALGGCICKVVGKVQFCILFAPWFLIVILGCLLDVAATVFHIIDITNTRSLPSVLDYLGIKSADIDSLTKYTNFSQDFLIIPIIAVCITSKLVILWLVNLFGSFMALTQLKKIVYDRKVDPFFTDYNSNKPEQQNDAMITKPKNGSKTLNNQRENSSGALQRPNDNNNSPSYAQSAILRRITQNYDRQPSEDKNYQIQEGNQNRLSSGSGASHAQSSKEKVHLTEELRSQLPWTYLNFSKDLSKSMKVLQHHEEHEVPPPMPVPDYETEFHAPVSSSLQSRVMHRPSTAHRS